MFCFCCSLVWVFFNVVCLSGVSLFVCWWAIVFISGFCFLDWLILVYFLFVFVIFPWGEGEITWSWVGRKVGMYKEYFEETVRDQIYSMKNVIKNKILTSSWNSRMQILTPKQWIEAKDFCSGIREEAEANHLTNLDPWDHSVTETPTIQHTRALMRPLHIYSRRLPALTSVRENVPNPRKTRGPR